jgi:predicted O-methyltransferase YrrM
MDEKRPDREQIMEMTAAFMQSCVIGAATELDLFTLLGDDALPAEQIAASLGSDLRATTMLLDAVASLGLLEKRESRYSVPAELRPLLVEGSPQTVLPMLQHRMNILRSWAQLAWVAKAGIPAPRPASIRGPAADRAAFVAAMHSVSGPVADELVGKLDQLKFEHLLDVGGASGTWTLAFLKAVPQARATIFDLPDAVEQARERIGRTEFAQRIRLTPGDYFVDDLPTGADFAWLSAVVHQHSRAQCRALYASVFSALQPGGHIAIRDIVMQPDRTRPALGALFAINMLVNTEGGGTFTFEEIAEDLRSTGFISPQWAIQTDDMNSVILATKP